MKNKVYTLWTLILSLLIFCSIAKAQTLEFEISQPLTISSPGFFPFSTVANNTFKEILPTNDTLTLQFSNFLGSPCAVAPAADFAEIGPQIIINGNGELTINFSNPPINPGQFGLSLVPQGGTCIFDLFIPPPAGTSSTSGGIIIEQPSGDDTITPNSLTIFGTFLPDTLTEQLSSESNNPLCGNSPFGINPLVINGTDGDDVFNVITNEFGLGSVSGQRSLNKAFKDEPDTFTLAIPEGKNNANTVYVQKLTNITDMTKIFVTGVFPSFSSENNLMLGGRISDFDLEVTLKEQNLVALAAVQHAIVSATMPWQLSKNGGFFITQGGGCLSPFCVIVESGMIVVDPDGACTPDKLNKRKSGYPTFNPSKFFDPFPFASKTIQIPADNIVDPKHPLVSQVVKDNAYLILQPVPPGAKINQQLKFMLKK